MIFSILAEVKADTRGFSFLACGGDAILLSQQV